MPALVGRGQALLELGRDGDALASFEAALKADPSLTDLQGRIEVLRFRAVQDNLARAKAASDAGRLDEARAAYGQAIAASPDSAFLYRDLALVERKAGEHAAGARALPQGRRARSRRRALAWRRSARSSRSRATSPARSRPTKRRGRSIPDEVPAERIAELREAAALAEDARRIPRDPVVGQRVARAEVAALIGVRLAPLLAQRAPRQAVITDVRGHWAQQWILPVVRAGIMDTQPNYTFQPNARVRRGDLAQTVSRVLSADRARASPRRPKRGRARAEDRRRAAQATSAIRRCPQAVASGVMPLAENGAFQLLRPVTGAEAVDVVARLEALAKP